jgi:NaMN:DMB phosphoribosyltransferase
MTGTDGVVEAITSRITLPGDLPTDVDPDLTGELGELTRWWRGLSGTRFPVAADVVAAAVPGESAIEWLAAGADATDRAVDAGASVIVPRIVERDPQAARVIISILTRAEPQVVVPQSAGMPDRAWMAEVAEVRDRVGRAVGLRGEPIALLDAVRAPGLAFCVGALLSGAARQTACIIDGTDELAAAVVADRLSTSAKAWWTAGSQSPDAGRQASMDRIGLRPGLALDLTDEHGWGARSLLALLGLVTGEQAEPTR